MGHLVTWRTDHDTLGDDHSLLIGEVSPAEEKGYKPLLYLGLKCCPAEKHVHVQCNMDLISLLIARAEPELVGR